MIYREFESISYPVNGHVKAPQASTLSGRKKETIAEMHASTPWTSTLAAMTALAVVFIVKSLAKKAATKIGV